MFKPKGPYCQSCGMPLSKDARGGGTNADGSKNTEYCSNCYENGKFTEPDITMEQMHSKVIDMMKTRMHFPGFIAKYFAKDIPTLKRWTK